MATCLHSVLSSRDGMEKIKKTAISLVQCHTHKMASVGICVYFVLGSVVSGKSQMANTSFISSRVQERHRTYSNDFSICACCIKKTLNNAKETPKNNQKIRRNLILPHIQRIIISIFLSLFFMFYATYAMSLHKNNHSALKNHSV